MADKAAAEKAAADAAASKAETEARATKEAAKVKAEAEAKMAQLKKDGVKQIEIVSEDLDAQPQDKDVKKKKGTQPKKYYKDLSKGEKEKRARKNGITKAKAKSAK